MSFEPRLSDGVAEAPQGARERADATVRGLEAAFNHGDFSGVREFTSPDAISHEPTMSRSLQGMRGPEPFVRQVSTYRDAFPDLRFVVEDTIAEGERVVVRWRAEGTHRGPLQGLAPTGVSASTTGTSISRWQGGKVVESWVQWDNLGLARQIGAAPPEGSVSERLAAAAQQLIARRMRRRSAG